MPYETLKGSNILGTNTALKIASKHHLKLFCYVSTLSIFNGNPHDDFSETAEITTDNLSFVGGYAYGFGFAFCFGASLTFKFILELLNAWQN